LRRADEQQQQEKVGKGAGLKGADMPTYKSSRKGKKTAPVKKDYYGESFSDGS
jgi:hypothetical protein